LGLGRASLALLRGNVRTTEVIAGPDQATPERLTQLLREKGYLDRGNVISVAKVSRGTPVSIISHLTLAYSDDALQSAPARLFLKTAKSEYGARGKREVEFYNTIAPLIADAPVVHCYDAAICSNADQFHILLDDLSETHFQTDLRCAELIG
jgi:hypothetical protein